MKKILASILFSFLVFLFSTTSLYAADFHANKTVTLDKTNTNLHDVYLFGGTLITDTPITNDLVAAGGNINVNADVSGSVLAAGGTIIIHGNVGNTIRVAGGNITIDGAVARDVVILGGNVILTSHARVNGDVVFAGGSLDVEAPVNGKLVINGGAVRIDNVVGGDVSGNIRQLTLGPKTYINGNLTYSSPQKAQIENGASIKGTTHFTQTQRQNRFVKSIHNSLSWFTLYKLLIDIAVTFLFITFFAKYSLYTIKRIKTNPIRSFLLGLVFLIIVPIVSLILLVFILPGILLMLFYLLLLFLSTIFEKVLFGWFVLHLWEKSQKREYTLDWKAAIVGPIILALLLFIPIIGWLVAFIGFLLSLGGMSETLLAAISGRHKLSS